MATWTFHGGCRTIGGTVIELIEDGWRLVFDLGRAVSRETPVFDGALRPAGIGDLQRMGAVPRIAGLFCDAADAPEFAGRTLVAISHAHLDHMAHLPLLRPEIPVLVTNGTMKMLTLLDVLNEGVGQIRYQAVAPGDAYSFGPFRIRLLPVDHDIPGAAGMLIQTPSVRFVYSGDLRLHGRHADRTFAFAEEARKFAPDVLWIEGTRALAKDNSDIFYESELPDRYAEVIGEADAGVYCTHYPRHPERLDAIRQACLRTGRTLAACAGSAYVYAQFGGDLTGCAIYSGGQSAWSGTLRQFVAECGLPLVAPENLRGVEQRFVVELPYARLRDWIDIEPAPGVVYLHADGHPLGPYDPAWANLQYWLAAFGARFVRVGSSGHGSRGDIHQLIEHISPRVVLPIHSFAPEQIAPAGVARFLPQEAVGYTLDEILDEVGAVPEVQEGPDVADVPEVQEGQGGGLGKRDRSAGGC